MKRSVVPPPRFDVSVIGTVGLPARYGGFETLTEQLARRWSGRITLQVFCTEVGADAMRPDTFEGARLQYLRWDANGWQSIPYDIVSMWLAARHSNTLLVLGVSGCIALPLIRLRAPATRIVAHIDGLEWRRRKWGWGARLFLRLSEWMAVRFAHAVIADNQAIVEHVERSYGGNAALIAYGGDHVITGRAELQPPETRFSSGRYNLSICRIEPENSIEAILQAFADQPNDQLVLVGNWEHSAFARNMRKTYGGLPNIELKDPIYDQARLEALRRNACAYVHGHSAGGTNPSLVEAMSSGLAVLAFDVSYNRYTTGHVARYWRTSAELSQLLRQAKQSDMAHMALQLSQLAAQHYTWCHVAEQYERVVSNQPPTSADQQQRRKLR
jgi:glycosyltransferase involved in cell wall biosynthesis